MTKEAFHVARVLDVKPEAGGKFTVLLVTEKGQIVMEWPLPAQPVEGEVYKLSATKDLTIIGQLTQEKHHPLEKGSDVLRWRRPDKNGRTRIDVLRARHAIKRAVRDYLDAEGFIEIDMPLLVKGTTPDSEIESFKLEERYLVTSTEYQIKRMEIGGFDRSYTLTQNFRKGDGGQYRNPEFTMLEWARVGETLGDIEHDMEQMLYQAHLRLGGNDKLVYQGREIDIKPPFARMSVTEAIRKSTGVTLRDFSAESFAEAVRATDMVFHDVDMNDAPHLFSHLMDHIQPDLGLDKPVFIRDWPLFQTSSAKEHESGKLVERSELFIAGIELSDGFPSLLDPVRQEQTFKIQNDRRRKQGAETVELDLKYVSAMREGFPSGAGMALGFDRLVMILTDQENIATVLAYGWDEL